MLTALIVDDHVAVRQGLVKILNEEFEEISCAEAANANDAVRLVTKRAWDIVILDIGLPGRSGLQLLKDIRRLSPESRVLILTVHAESQYAARAIRLGASGYMTKDRVRSDLVRAIRNLLAGETYLGVPLSGPRLPHEALSQREFKVMMGLAAGKRVTDIALEMSLSVKTISTYKRRIFDKMELRVTADLTRYAIEHGLL